jgi:hypothetical protein
MASHIYERTLLLILLAKIHAVFPVGLGGILEISSRLLLDDHLREFRDRPMIFYSPKYDLESGSAGLMEPVMTALVGATGYIDLRDDSFKDDAGHRLPYFFASSLERFFQLIESLLDIS